MKIRFLIEYHTHWGEEVCIHAEQYADSAKSTVRIIPMATEDGQHWLLEMKLPNSTKQLVYRYVIRENDEITREEWHVTERTIQLSDE
ncbi:MAG: hypothetical protein HUJ99_04920, partial [Bacteroidaceae bacterium]|nr:hypothetical protein [Bacteroidaceae bacterium]